MEETLSPQPSNPATSGASPNWEAPPTSPKNSVETVMEFFPPVLIRIQPSMIGRKYSPFTAMDLNIKGMWKIPLVTKDETSTFEARGTLSNSFTTSIKHTISTTKTQLYYQGVQQVEWQRFNGYSI